MIGGMPREVIVEALQRVLSRITWTIFWRSFGRSALVSPPLSKSSSSPSFLLLSVIRDEPLGVRPKEADRSRPPASPARPAE